VSGDAGTNTVPKRQKQGRLRETDENGSTRLYCNVFVVDIIFFLLGFGLEYEKEGVMSADEGSEESKWRRRRGNGAEIDGIHLPLLYY
jgi:hypothetical protein